VEAQRKKITPNFNEAIGKDYVVFEGTVLETVLVTRLNGEFSGPVICMLTNNIYSHDGQRLLIPAGTKVMGETKRVDGFGQTRLAVVFHRLIMPDGYSVDLDQFQGLNQIGETGLKDKVNHHYLQIFGASIAVGAIAGLAEAGTNTSSVGLALTPADAYRQGVATSLAQSSTHILDRFLNLLPTITIREGHRVKVYLTQDLLVPDYAQHEMPSNL
jgi:type IV secretion system protein VirB10